MSSNVERYTKACDDEWVVIRFVDELKVTAMFIGTDYKQEDLVHSADRIWLRYFGASAVPRGFYEQLYPLVSAVSKRRPGMSGGHLKQCLSGHPCYRMGNALYEVVAIAMHERWIGDCVNSTIPFEYKALVGVELPNGRAAYRSRFGHGSIPPFPVLLLCVYCITQLFFSVGPRDEWYWTLPGLSGDQRIFCTSDVGIALVSRAAESVGGRPSVIQRMMEHGLFHHYVSTFNSLSSHSANIHTS